MATVEKPVKTDLLIMGSGIAGLRCAIEAAEYGLDVIVATKDFPRESNTLYAQGGIAAAVDPDDSPRSHFEDTIRAGDGLCEEKAVKVLVEDGAKRIRELISWGAEFDRESGALHLTREGAHSLRRILHAGDSTGKEIERVLMLKMVSTPGIKPLAFHMGLSLAVEDGKLRGAYLLDEESRTILPVRARAVLLATGGAGRLFQESTNSSIATGDGMVLALEAGIVMSNLEFVQFHPTALHFKGAPRFLLSEAMRGEGALLKNGQGERFMARYDSERMELAPRDIVARAIVDELRKTKAQHVFLDLSHLDHSFVRNRFPTIYATCISYGLDITKEMIPVHPAAHYIMGGVETDIWGRTSAKGVYAAGEVACTGVHGANRLASNSLLEGLVFGYRAGRAILDDAHPMPRIFKGRPPEEGKNVEPKVVTEMRRQIAARMWKGAGILRNGHGLQSLENELLALESLFGKPLCERRARETWNMLQLGKAIAASAEYRTESRGAHYREDHPLRDDRGWKRPTRLTMEGKDFRFIGGSGVRSRRGAF
ncbi:MAG TPA: L-aspartate oxidase [Acidobacteriota bacterium]|nr:L-aspartate oxidase [Acidobacteriota bacterium]HNT16692.1 L-aspartate oxidase [Acidobacteriota bacterium]